MTPPRNAPSVPGPPQGTRTVLFLCTANYFRSRLAEALFNIHASHAGLRWRGTSRALARQPHLACAGPVSPHVAETLRARGLAPTPSRIPLELGLNDLQTADLRIALCEREHRPLLAARFPEWEERVEYWHCEDVSAMGPDGVALTVESNIRRLLARLENADPAGPTAPT